MSYFVFGTFKLAKPMDERVLKDIAFAIVECGLSHRLCLQLGHNIVQAGLLFEMFDFKQGSIPADSLPFLMTDSPISDTSDGLISPYHVGLGDEPSLLVNLTRMKRFLVGLAQVHNVAGIDVYFTEGYDHSFEEISVSPDRFDEVALKVFEPAPEIPSTRFVLRWSGRT